MRNKLLGGICVALFLASIGIAVAGGAAVPNEHPGKKIGSVSVSPGTQTVYKGDKAPYTVKVTRASGLGSEGLFEALLSVVEDDSKIPSDAISFSPNPVIFKPQDNEKDSLLTIDTSSLSPGTYTFKVRADRYPAGPEWDYAVSELVTLIVSEGGATGRVSRTQGFWATHWEYSKDKWLEIEEEERVIGSKNMGDGSKDVEEMLGAFWSSIAWTSEGERRSRLDQARMQLVQQLIAAMLNVQAFGDDELGTGVSLIVAAKEAFSSDDRGAILSLVDKLTAFNEAGEGLPLPPDVDPGTADPAGAKNMADIGFWDELP